MPAPEIHNAMQTGVIDGAMIDLSTLDGFKLNEVRDYITRGMNTRISPFFLIMNRDIFDNLTAMRPQRWQERSARSASKPAMLAICRPD